MCTEEKTLYKIISGLHANINVHLSHNYLNIEQNISYMNSTMLEERVLNHPERINNLFFLYSLLLKAFYQAEEIIKSYDYYTGNDQQDNSTKTIINNLFHMKDYWKNLCEDCLKREISFTYQCKDFDKFWDFNPNKLDQLKMRFRNISSIIDCVSCQKCKLHGKLQIYGLGTMFKILFSPASSLPSLKRNELISFVNLVGKVSRAVKYIKDIEFEKIKQNTIYKLQEDRQRNIFTRVNYQIYLHMQKWFDESDIEFLQTAFLFSILFVLLIFLNVYFIKNKDEIVRKYENKYEDKLRRAREANKYRIYEKYNQKSTTKENYLIRSEKMKEKSA